MNINVSVIVLLKKETENIVHLFSSLAEQSLKEIEVIILQASKCEKYSYEISTLRDKVASLTINQFDLKYTDSDLIIEGCKLVKGKYVIVIDENCIFESRTLEELFETAEQNSADIVQFKVHTVPAPGVTEYQAGIYAEEFAIRSGEMNQLDLLNECYLKNEVSKRIIGKLVGTDVIFKAIELAEKYGGSYEELIFFFCVVSCNKYVSLINKTYMNYSLMPEVILAVTSKEFNDKLNRKKICEVIDQFASEHILDQNGSNIFVQIADQAYIAELKKIITLWLSPRVQENQRQNYLIRIIEVWGIRDVICAMASWIGANRERYVKHLINILPAVVPEDIKCIACFSSACEPLSNCTYITKRVKFIREDMKQISNTDSENVVYIPKPKGILWYRGRFDAIAQGIKNHKIDAVWFEKCELGSIWDMLCARSCGAYILVDDRGVKTLTALHRQNDLSAYFKYFFQLLFADIAVLPPDADVTGFNDLGITCTYSEDNLINLLMWNRNTREMSRALPYLNEILFEKYQQDLSSKNRELKNINNVLGPYKSAILRIAGTGRLKSALQRLIWKDKFWNSSIIGKIKLLIKTFIRISKIKNINLGLQGYYPTKKTKLKNKIISGLSIVKMLFTDPRLLFDKIQRRKRWKVACEKHMSLGKDNPDRVFYLVRLNPGNDGLLLSYLRILRELEKLENSNYTPIIDMKWAYYVMAHNTKRDRGHINGWEMYFNPVCGYSLDDIKHSKNVVRGQVCYREQIDNYIRSNILRAPSSEMDMLFQKWCEIDHKYISLKPDLLNEFNDEFGSIMAGKRTIGVMIREGYAVLNKLNYALIANHAVQPEIDAVIRDLSIYLEEWKCDQIFVSAEYVDTITRFQQIFGEKLVYTIRTRKNFSAQDPNEYRNKREEYYSKISREQINRDYLKEVYLLSRCTCLLAGRASASIVASLWNNGKYEHRKIYDLGKYQVTNTKPMVSLSDKQ